MRRHAAVTVAEVALIFLLAWLVILLLGGCCSSSETLIRPRIDTVLVPKVEILDWRVWVPDTTAYARIDSLLALLDSLRALRTPGAPSMRVYEGHHITARQDTVDWRFTLAPRAPVMSITVRHAPVPFMHMDTTKITAAAPPSFWRSAGFGLIIFAVGLVVGVVVGILIKMKLM